MLSAFARKSEVSGLAVAYSGTRLLNYYARPTDDAVSPVVLVGASGSKVLHTVGGTTRAMDAVGGVLYVVSGGRLLVIDGSVTAAGSFADDPYSTMASDGMSVAVVADGKYYVWDGTTFAEYATGAVDVPKGVTYQDGYAIVWGEVAGRRDGFTVSGLNDFKTFDGTDFAFAENNPDGLQSIISDHGQLWLLGGKSIETWYNSGAADFPFARNAGGIIEKGCLDGRTVAKADSSVFWVGDDRIVYRASGASPTVVSSRAIEEELVGSVITGGFTYRDRGTLFYCIRREGQTTLCHDITTGLWSERSTGLGEGPWQCTARATLSGVDVFGTSRGVIVQLDADTYTDAGEVLEAMAVSLPIEQGGEWFAVSKVHVNIRGGVSTMDRAPRVMLQVSKDGRTWGAERWRDMGRLGEYYQRAAWYGLGTQRRFQVRLRITDPVSRDILGVDVD